MLHSIYVNHESVCRVLEKMKKYEFILSDEEINNINTLTCFLSKFAEATKVMEGEDYATLNLAVQYRELLHGHLMISDKDPELLKLLKKNMSKNWDRRLPSLRIHIAAALLDVTTRNLNTVIDFLTGEGKTPEQFLREVADELQIPLDDKEPIEVQLLSSSDNEKIAKKMRFLKMYSREGSASLDSASEFEDEVQQFMSIPITKECLLLECQDWWQKSKNQFPPLSKLARFLFAIPSTSAAIERSWSSAGLIITSKRSQLSANNFRNLIFVHENYDFVKNGDQI